MRGDVTRGSTLVFHSRAGDGANPEGICIPLAPGRTSRPSPQARFQPVTHPLCTWNMIATLSDQHDIYLSLVYYHGVQKVSRKKVIAVFFHTGRANCRQVFRVRTETPRPTSASRHRGSYFLQNAATSSKSRTRAANSSWLQSHQRMRSMAAISSGS